MPPPIPSKASALPSPAAPALGISTSGGQHQVVVRYYRRMKPQRVYRLVVELHSLAKTGPAPAADAVQVRPLIPGCVISPPELEVVPKASNRVTFYVTPLAKGRLRDARVGLYHQGRILQDVKLRMKSVTQCLTRWLLFLTVAAPLFVWWTLHLPLSSMGPIQKTEAAEVQKPEGLNAAEAPAAEAETPKPKLKVHRPLARFIVDNVPEYQGYTKQAARQVQEGYDFVHAMPQRDHLSFWVCVSFLGLTLLSLVTHRQARGKRKGKPLALPAPPTTPDFGGSDALSFNIPTQPIR